MDWTHKSTSKESEKGAPNTLNMVLQLLGTSTIFSFIKGANVLRTFNKCLVLGTDIELFFHFLISLLLTMSMDQSSYTWECARIKNKETSVTLISSLTLRR